MAKMLVITKAVDGFILSSTDDIGMSNTYVCPKRCEELAERVLRLLDMLNVSDKVKVEIISPSVVEKL